MKVVVTTEKDTSDPLGTRKIPLNRQEQSISTFDGKYDHLSPHLCTAEAEEGEGEEKRQRNRQQGIGDKLRNHIPKLSCRNPKRILRG